MPEVNFIGEYPQKEPAIHKSSKEFQRLVIDALAVLPIEQALPSELLHEYNKRKDQVGDSSIDLPDGRTVRFSGTPNHIVLLEELKRIHESSKLSPVYAIQNYFILDGITNMACDVSQLWSHTRANVTVVPEIFTPVILWTSPEPTLILNQFKNVPHSFLHGIPKDQVPILEVVSHFHEIGHMLQKTPAEVANISRGTLHYFLKHQFKRPGKLEKIDRFLDRLSAIFFPEKKMPAIGTIAKNSELGQNERNADAFALGVVRKLRELHIDLLRDTGPRNLRTFDQRALVSHL